MADEHVSSPSPQSSSTGQPQTTDIQGAPRPPAGQQPPVASNGQARLSAVAKVSSASELRLLLGWLAGVFVVIACGWGALALAMYLTRSSENMRLVGILTYFFTLALFLLLEHDHWLSRLMGLRYDPDSPGWKSALLFWAVGVGVLLFRSTAAPATARADTRGQPLPASARRGRQQQDSPQTDSTREIIETVVFVVVLVLLLKSFAAEAFVIPTGSMAETLWGYQKVVECKSCGHKFPVNCSDEVDPSDGEFAHVFACICPNCLQPLHFDDTPPEVLQNYLSQNHNSVAIRDPGWSSGDRVLVAKFLYSLLENDPDRLDVVVFKYPGDGSFPRSGPQKNHTPMNYIKRLVGLSGESIAIFRGKLYVLPPDKGLEYDDYKTATPEQRKMLWQRRHMHINEKEAIDRFRQGDSFRILRKDPRNILAMMRPVYDDTHPPIDSEGKSLPPRWAPREEGAWASFPAEHSFRHPSGSGDQTDWLPYRHSTRRWGGKPGLITDVMGYNSGFSYYIPPADSRRDFARLKKDRLPGENWASDLILEGEVTPDKAEGKLMLELSKGVDRFRAVWDLPAQTCTLFRLTPGGREDELASKPSALKPGSSHRLRFANVDERLTVWVDNNLLFGDGVVYPPAKEGGPRPDNDLERPASIGAQGAGLSVRNLKLYRDTYYTATENAPSAPDTKFEPEDPTTWGELQDDSRMPVLTMYVQPEHYLCLGDNSPESSDGRSWGTVPRRLLLGRALLVYYPFSRAGRIR
jgi:signal peptidase I